MSKKNRKNRGKRQNSPEMTKKTVLQDDTNFSVKEAYKLTRTNILYSLTEDGCKNIAITSAYESEGKTTTTTNIALSFAQLEKRILIIDADMRRPKVHNVFSLDNQVGLSNILGGFAEVSDAIHKVNYGLDVITSGHIPPNPVELLASSRMKSLIKQLGESYDYIFIDTPPVNVVTDTIILSEILSGIVIVTKQGYSTHNELNDALDKFKLSKVKLLGIVLTGGVNKRWKYRKYDKYTEYNTYEES